MAMSADHRSKFAALHRQWCRLHMSEKFSSGTINSKETNKQINSTESTKTYYFFIRRKVSDTLESVNLLPSNVVALWNIWFMFKT